MIAEVGREVVQVKLRNMAKQPTAEKFAKQARKRERDALVRERNIEARVRVMETNHKLLGLINLPTQASDNDHEYGS